jgi:hypothetical protein
MTKICTTIEQCKKLLDLGIDINTADLTDTNLPLQDGSRYDFICCKLPNDTFPSITDGKSEKIHAWSLSALLGLMPTDDKKDEYYVVAESHSDYHTVSYRNCWDGCIHSEYSEESLLDAAFEMVVWLKENNKI